MRSTPFPPLVSLFPPRTVFRQHWRAIPNWRSLPPSRLASSRPKPCRLPPTTGLTFTSQDGGYRAFSIPSACWCSCSASFSTCGSRKHANARLHYFSSLCGAAFLLLETQVISRLALYFGTTWQVNGFVIAALLTTLLLSNLVVERWSESLRRVWVLSALFAGLVIAYEMPFARIPGPAALAGTFAAIIFSLPVFFAGLLFAMEFRREGSPGAALGSNMLGAVLGGLLENLSLITGMRALLLPAIALYVIAALALDARPRRSNAVA
jgi:hypothetical protein